MITCRSPRRALSAGEVSADQAQTLATVTTTSPARRATLAADAESCGEAFLLAQAKALSAAELRNLARNWAAAVDPEADERGHREASEAEYVALSPTTGGFHLAGFLTTDHGATLQEALNAVMRAPIPGDRRTTRQRRARGLTDLARLALDHGLVGSGALVRPHLNVVVDYDTFVRAVEGVGFGKAGPATRPDVSSLVGDASRHPGAGRHGAREADLGRHGTQEAESAPFRLRPVMDVERFAVAEIVGAGPVPPSVLARLACDSTVSRLVFGPESQVIDAGRSERIFAGPRRRAIVARDRHCTFPACAAPPAIGELHHIDHWAHGGGSHTDRGTLLCWFHHELVHTRGIDITRTVSGGLIFDRGGLPLRMGPGWVRSHTPDQ